MTRDARPFAATSSKISNETFGRLHPTRIENRPAILAILKRLHRERIECHRGMNRQIDPEIAKIAHFSEEGIIFRTRNFEPGASRQLFLNFKLDGRPHFFSAQLLKPIGRGLVESALPAVIYHSERRDRPRRAVSDSSRLRIRLEGAGFALTEAHVEDASPTGLGVIVPQSELKKLTPQLRVHFLTGERAGQEWFADVCYREPKQTGWVKLGLECSEARRGAHLPVESRQVIAAAPVLRRAQQRWKIVLGGARVASGRVLRALGRKRPARPAVAVIDYKNAEGENLRAIVDSALSTRGAPAVIIPPAWGRTKETLMPLARTIVESFEAAGQPVVVVRFDGIRKRGESFRDADCRAPGTDHHRFTFSQGFRDIEATIDFLVSSRDFAPSRIILVSFSAASLEARRAVANDQRIDGWVSAVGTADLQSMMRVISGGVDYVGGLERGARFGLQEVLGVEVDIDRAGFDAFENNLAYLEDARRDMVKIRVPITWIHGRYDAWMDSARVRDALGRGDTSLRKLIEIPMGHMLKTSGEALQTFQLIAAEVSRMALGAEIEGVVPDVAGLESRRIAERERLPRGETDTRKFWKDYLLGQGPTLGFELMTSISPYQELMATQVRGLQLGRNHTVLDLGSGTGALPAFLARTADAAPPLRVLACDYIREAHQRARERLATIDGADRLRVSFVECDLDSANASRRIPVASGSVQAVLASLFLSYVAAPGETLKEIHRVLAPNGILVASTLRRDADMSKLYSEGATELRSGLARELFGGDVEQVLDESLRTYLNEASRLLDFEEAGTFRFWDPDEFVQLIKKAGFCNIQTAWAFGHPPQAVVATARRA